MALLCASWSLGPDQRLGLITIGAGNRIIIQYLGGVALVGVARIAIADQ
jgi:hypothetical protein